MAMEGETEEYITDLEHVAACCPCLQSLLLQLPKLVAIELSAKRCSALAGIFVARILVIGKPVAATIKRYGLCQPPANPLIALI